MEMTKFDEMAIKISHINVINMMEDKIGKKISTFDELVKYTLKNLEELRDNLVIEYNDVMEARMFGAEMISRGTHTKKDDWREKFLKNNSDEELVKLATDKMYFVNKDDWIRKFWKNNYHVWMTAQGIEFCVNADHEQDALDFIMDFCVEKELVGLYSKELGEEDDEYITAGNFGYKFTTHNIRIVLMD